MVIFSRVTTYSLVLKKRLVVAMLFSRSLNLSVKHFVNNGSKVHCTFLDASKAFDKVLLNGLYVKLIERGAPFSFIRILMVRWQNTSLSNTTFTSNLYPTIPFHTTSTSCLYSKHVTCIVCQLSWSGCRLYLQLSAVCPSIYFMILVHVHKHRLKRGKVTKHLPVEHHIYIKSISYNTIPYNSTL